MISQPVFAYRLASSGDSVSIGGAGAATQLAGITVNTGAASAVVTVFASNPSTAGSKIAVIDASTAAGTAPRTAQYHGANCKNGLQVYLSGGNADVTVTAS